MSAQSRRTSERDQVRAYPAPDFVKPQERRAIGAHIFVESALSADALGKSLEQVAMDRPLRLKVFSNRGTKVYTPTGVITDCVDHWGSALSVVPGAMSMTAPSSICSNGHVEKLPEYDGVKGFTMAQSED